jgi:hypothetical protein
MSQVFHRPRTERHPETEEQPNTAARTLQHQRRARGRRAVTLSKTCVRSGRVVRPFPHNRPATPPQKTDQNAQQRSTGRARADRGWPTAANRSATPACPCAARTSRYSSMRWCGDWIAGVGSFEASGTRVVGACNDRLRGIAACSPHPSGCASAVRRQGTHPWGCGALGSVSLGTVRSGECVLWLASSRRTSGQVRCERAELCRDARCGDVWKAAPYVARRVRRACRVRRARRVCRTPDLGS